MDGYPKGHGVELAELCNVTIVNGYGGGDQAGTHANGMGCLAAQIVKGLKDGIGGIYLEPTGGEIGEWTEYVYVVRGKTGKPVTIECSTHTGEWPFNVQDKDELVFTGTAAAWLKKYSRSRAAQTSLAI